MNNIIIKYSLYSFVKVLKDFDSNLTHINYKYSQIQKYYEYDLIIYIIKFKEYNLLNNNLIKYFLIIKY